MPIIEWTRTTGQRLTYSITYDDGEYFIERDGILKRQLPDAFLAGISPDRKSVV